MANKPREQRDTEIIKQAVKRVNEYMSLNAHNITTALNDLRMLVDEDHWKDGETDFEKARKDDGRPCLIMNRLPGFVSQVIGDLRANRPSCKCHPADNKGTIEIADILEGRIRNIEAESTADAVYDNGAEQAAKCSFGSWRVVTEYGDEDNFFQRIRIKAIYNQFAVAWDPMSQEWDKTDAEWCAVLSKIHKDTYKEKYKGKSPSNFDANRGGMHWYIGDTYTLCEYFRRENDGSKMLYMVPLKDDDLGEFTEQWMDIKVQYAYTNGQIIKELPEVLREIWPKLLKDDKVKQRKVQKRKIMRYLLSGHEVLEEPQEWVSNVYWPIVPVVGKLTNIDGKVYTESVIRKSKDAQKAYNFGRNTAIEDIALVPKAPYMVTPEQIKGFEPMWKMALKKTFAFLYYNKDPKSPMEGPPQRIQPVQASTAITESTMLAVDEMRATTNVFDPGMQQVSPDMSGKAVLARVSRAGVANYEFIDNVGRSIALTWRILLDIIPKVEDTQREVRLKKPDGSVRTEKINWVNEQHQLLRPGRGCQGFLRKRVECEQRPTQPNHTRSDGDNTAAMPMPARHIGECFHLPRQHHVPPFQHFRH